MPFPKAAISAPVIVAGQTNTPQGLIDGDRKFRHELEEQEKLLARDRSRDPKLEDIEKTLADRQAQ